MSEKQIRSETASQPQVAPELTAKFFRGLGDPTRLKIIRLLMESGPITVGDLVRHLGQPQGRVSSHLACLRWCGYASSRQEGKYVYYSVTDPRVIQLVALAESMLLDKARQVECCPKIDGDNLLSNDD